MLYILKILINITRILNVIPFCGNPERIGANPFRDFCSYSVYE